MDPLHYVIECGYDVINAQQSFLQFLKLVKELRDESKRNRRISEGVDSINDYEEAYERNYTRRVNYLNPIRRSDTSCRNMTRMDCAAFKNLCDLLENHGDLKPSPQVTIEEMVAMFLYIVAHDVKNRVVAMQFARSGETVSRNFHNVLKAVLKLDEILLKKPEPIRNDCTDPRWKWFENCLGAIDGTYIEVNVAGDDNPSYRTRKGSIATNVFAACAPNGEFIYVLSGWEGSAADSRILRDAIARPDGFKVPRGYYYLCDAGYPNAEGFLAPHRGERYHLTEWRGNGNNPQTPREHFNMRHSQARNIIERTFGALKNRWAILRNRDHYSVDVKADVVIACTYLHNHCIREMGEGILDEFNNSDTVSTASQGDTSTSENIPVIESTDEWAMYREMLGYQMKTAWESTMASSSRPVKTRHHWTTEDEQMLVDALLSLVGGNYHSRAGNFRKGYALQVVQYFRARKPELDIDPYSIECKTKTLKRHYMAIKEMKGPAGSGFGWNEATNCVQMERAAFDNWVTSHPGAKGLYNKPFSYLDQLSLVFCCDAADGHSLRTPRAARCSDVQEDIADDVHLGSDVAEDIFTPASDRPSSSMRNSQSSGTKRKRSERKSRLDEIVDRAAANQQSQMEQMMAAQEARYAELTRRQMEQAHSVEQKHMEAMRRVGELGGFTEIQKQIVLEEVCQDPLKLNFFVTMKPEWVERYCTNLILGVTARSP